MEGYFRKETTCTNFLMQIQRSKRGCLCLDHNRANDVIKCALSKYYPVCAERVHWTWARVQSEILLCDFWAEVR
jgi:hypothetical protein